MIRLEKLHKVVGPPYLWGTGWNTAAVVAGRLLLSVPAVVTIGMRARIVDTNMTTKEYAFPIVEADGANSSNPPFIFENR